MKEAIIASITSLLTLSPVSGEIKISAGPGGSAQEEASASDSQTIDKQQGMMWCWAASISAIFKHYGHPVDQKIIVSRIKGVPIDRPGWPVEMTAALSAAWTDSNGKSFQSRCSIHDMLSGVSTFNNDHIIGDLGSGHPLLYCTSTHAMVLVSAVSQKWPTGLRTITRAEVLDPATGTRRELNPAIEGFPIYAARIRIE